MLCGSCGGIKVEFYLEKEVNEAILKVLSTQYKKDAKEAHKIVETAGYEIYKSNGCFTIKNPKTYRYIQWTECRWRYNYKLITTTKDIYFDDWKDLKINFVNYLNKPINKDKQYINSEWFYTSKAKEKYELLRSLKWDIEYHTREVERQKALIEKAKKSIEYHERRIKEEKDSLEETRIKLGLKKGA